MIAKQEWVRCMVPELTTDMENNEQQLRENRAKMRRRGIENITAKRQRVLSEPELEIQPPGDPQTNVHVEEEREATQQ